MPSLDTVYRFVANFLRLLDYALGLVSRSPKFRGPHTAEVEGKPNPGETLPRPGRGLSGLGRGRDGWEAGPVVRQTPSHIASVHARPI